MWFYNSTSDPASLEPWPLDNPASDYRIVRGAPKTFGRIERGGPGHATRQGIWRCTPGAFECTEQGDELMTVLSGRCCVTWLEQGTSRVLEPGDTLFLLNGSRVRWDVSIELTKVFFAHLPEGY
ncbi:MAG: cupin domain-containing protein [Pseudomonadota bacterium]